MKEFRNFEDSKMFKGVPIKKQQENPFRHFNILKVFCLD